MNLANAFKGTLLATLAIKLLLAWLVPLSGDEAYFVLWANHLDFGYYDHPPMVGWFLHLMLYVGSAEVLLRLPAILTSIIIGIGIYHLLKPLDESKAALIAMLFLVSPINILNVLVTTDTPLILFAFFSIASLYKAQQHNKFSWFALSGIFFGLAFLSKYFAVLLGLSYLAYFIFSAKNPKKSKGFILLFAASLPFALINIYWNYTHCWDNILFNLYTRNEDAQLSLRTVAMFAGAQLYLMTPPLVWFLYKHREAFWQKIKRDQFSIFLSIFVVPIAVFALLSLKKTVGLHWVLAFYPALYLLIFQILPRIALEKMLKFMLGFTALHLLAIAVIASLPMETWKQHNLYGGIVFMFEPEKIVDVIRPYDQQNFLLATDGYSPSATISYHYGKEFFVFGEGGLHARQDDMLTDFRPFQGRNILILSKSAPNMQEYTPYFKRVETRIFTLRDTNFHLVLGYGFNFEQYKEGILRPIRNKYYRIPAYLPHASCYFCEKYFPGECSPALK
ncbi:MAG TPA: glycosyltransferase family 39 protein [Gallionellaceae bacterium]|nr:glycosyltransferase family 39 protein [Gallionellaceae bacterium]